MAYGRREHTCVGEHRTVLRMTSMRRRPLVLGAVAAVALISGCGRSPPQAAAAGSAQSPLLITDAVISSALARGRPVVIELGSNACAACRDVRSELDKLRATHPDQVEIVEIDLIRQRDYITRYRVQLMPTQVFYSAQGKELGRNVGRIDASGILARLGVAP